MSSNYTYYECTKCKLLFCGTLGTVITGTIKEHRKCRDLYNIYATEVTNKNMIKWYKVLYE